MNVCIVDDSKNVADAMKKVLLSYSKELKEKIECYTFYNSEDFNKWIDDNSVDICFLDINLKIEEDAYGLKIAKRLKQINYRTLIIFISGFNDYYVDMVQFEPFRFLHKPFTFDEFITVFKLAYERYSLQNYESVCRYEFKYNGIVFSTDLNKVKYIYSLKRKICMKTSRGDILEFYGKLDKVESEILELSKNFLRIGKSYLVNIKYIKSFNKSFVQIDDEEFSIGAKYKDNVLDVLDSKIIT